VIGALLHQRSISAASAVRPSRLQVLEDVDEHIAFHQAELGVIRRVAHHRDGGLVGVLRDTSASRAS
jgi:hypothetical protein